MRRARELLLLWLVLSRKWLLNSSRARSSEFVVGEFDFLELPALTPSPSYTGLRGDPRVVD
jgi:hypothetical protein